MSSTINRIVGGEGMGQIVHPSGTDSIFMCGADGFVRSFMPTMEQFKDGKDVEVADEELHTIAFNPKGDKFVCGGKDHEVSLYNYPSLAKDSIALRTGDDINHLQFSPNGSMVAVATDDKKLKVFQVYDPEQVTILTGHEAGVRSLCYDPKGEYLASADCTGMWVVHKLTSGTKVGSMRLCGKAALDHTDQNLRFDWHPSGGCLALPGHAQVKLVARGSWTVLATLQGHTDEVSVTAFSPNGQYLATAGRDQQLMVWDLASRKRISAQTLSHACTCVCWSRDQNVLTYFLSNGSIHYWGSPVPATLPSPFAPCDTPVSFAAPSALPDDTAEAGAEAPPAADASTHADSSAMVDDGAAEVAEGKMTDFSGVYGAEDSDNNSEPNHSSDDEDGGKRRLKRLKTVKQLTESALKQHRSEGAQRAYGEEEDVYGGYEEPDLAVALCPLQCPMQGPFQPGCTPESKKTRFLVWNELGSIISQSEDTYHLVYIQYSDSSKHRGVRLRDHYNFTMAALGEHGAVFASQSRKEGKVKTPSTIFYQPMDSWSPADWTLSLPVGEEATCVAIGTTWVAVATSAQHLRLFSYGGVQRMVLALEAPVVTMACMKNTLALVYHRGNPIAESQNLGLKVFDLTARKLSHEGPLPLSPASTLTWLAFSEDEMLYSMDSAGLLRGLTAHFGHQWAVLLDTTKAKQDRESSRATYWPVSVIEGKLMVTVCKGGRKAPRTKPKPLLTDMELAMPFVAPESGAAVGRLESTHAIKTLLAFQEGPAGIRDQIALDKLVLGMIQTACKADKIVRALDLSTLLNNTKSLNVAMTIANHNQKSQLADRIHMILQSKQREAAQQSNVVINQKDKDSLDDEPALSRTQEEEDKEDTSPRKLSGRKRLQKGGKTSARPLKKEKASPSPKKEGGNPFAKGSGKKKTSNPFGV